MRSFQLILLFIFLAGCQLSPTKVVVTSNHEVQRLVDKADKKIEITQDTQIIDVRSSFEYSMVHLPRAINLNWDHFTVKQEPIEGRLQDPDSMIRRLALKGLRPNKPVVVVGDGIKGEGEEGRVAWMLFYLGFQDVQTASMSMFQDALSNAASEPLPNVKPWAAKKIREGVDTTKRQFMDALEFRTKGEKIHFIDVRSKDEYFEKKGFGEAYKYPDFQAVQIEWKEFFTDDGRPRQQMRNKLREIDIGLNDRIIVISNKGLRSGAATYALLALGFSRASNFTGGYPELINRN